MAAAPVPLPGRFFAAQANLYGLGHRPAPAAPPPYIPMAPVPGYLGPPVHVDGAALATVANAAMVTTIFVNRLIQVDPQFARQSTLDFIDAVSWRADVLFPNTFVAFFYSNNPLNPALVARARVAMRNLQMAIAHARHLALRAQQGILVPPFIAGVVATAALIAANLQPPAGFMNGGGFMPPLAGPANLMFQGLPQLPVNYNQVPLDSPLELLYQTIAEGALAAAAVGAALNVLYDAAFTAMTSTVFPRLHNGHSKVAMLCIGTAGILAPGGAGVRAVATTNIEALETFDDFHIFLLRNRRDGLANPYRDSIVNLSSWLKTGRSNGQVGVVRTFNAWNASINIGVAAADAAVQAAWTNHCTVAPGPWNIAPPLHRLSRVNVLGLAFNCGAQHNIHLGGIHNAKRSRCTRCRTIYHYPHMAALLAEPAQYSNQVFSNFYSCAEVTMWQKLTNRGIP
ncbi:hypothetical protein B0O99DRAFT_592605 [Bisporella sp. PMI_857]|nr:hypothetical protein B0O99DRAFT_592605 [Bisporella sp. PMI_857]